MTICEKIVQNADANYYNHDKYAKAKELTGFV